MKNGKYTVESRLSVPKRLQKENCIQCISIPAVKEYHLEAVRAVVDERAHRTKTFRDYFCEQIL